MKAAWRRYEGPTWLVAASIYGGWIALAAAHGRLPFALALSLAIYLTAWHSSLQHETIHALRNVPRRVKTLLAIPPLGVWFPYEWYRREHLRHHATSELAAPADPESFYHDPERWARMPAPVRAVFLANQTFAGRLIVGPAVQIVRTYAAAWHRIRAGDRAVRRIWSAHLARVAVLAGVLQLCGIDPVWYLAFVAYPAASLGLVRSFAEHRFAASNAERTAVVESRSLLSLLFLNNNLHAVHHAFPALPWYEIPRRYRSDPRACGLATGLAPLRGYRSIVQLWLLRPIDVPVAEAREAVRARVR
jgi:fatty acid desaturase